MLKSLLTPRFVKFCVVGGSGLGVNMFFLWFFTEVVGIYYLLASPVAIEISVVTNFVLNDYWTWGDRPKHAGFGYLKRLVQYNLSVSIAAVIGNFLVLATLTERFGWNYLWANLAGIAVGTVINFTINDIWTFKEKSKGK